MWQAIRDLQGWIYSILFTFACGWGAGAASHWCGSSDQAAWFQAFGSFLAVAAAVVIFLGSEILKRREVHARDRLRAWKQVTTVYPIVTRLAAQLSADYEKYLAELIAKPSDEKWFDLNFKLEVEQLAAMLTDVDALPRPLALDLLSLVAWGRELNNMLELRITRLEGAVHASPQIADERMLKQVGYVKDCARFAVDVLDDLRAHFHAETVAIAAAMYPVDD